MSRKLAPEANRILFVKNLNYNVTAEQLFDLFGKFGPIRVPLLSYTKTFTTPNRHAISSMDSIFRTDTSSCYTTSRRKCLGRKRTWRKGKRIWSASNSSMG
ncbi:putative pre-mRNA branch site protein p14 [Aspergillus fumigatus Af293]|uniref:Pre-mRNA branch site protein p14, putative n=2 Tax=Aspergillus fumigatus TaxID=746128 RepID=Q4WHB8_ASPFU|nr:pre-mRNA branch site protein p14, putative [Aspergillus fumigatus Af293]EAL87687.1 pre-mRNA branch site protein p14, putative [Aspergillus fumigatus Af293]EDP54247.1 pre-mRNA branch site protein p14, putative [Aspergillus fumigatus A1163]